jgi:hypothetical protein
MAKWIPPLMGGRNGFSRADARPSRIEAGLGWWLQFIFTIWRQLFPFADFPPGCPVAASELKENPSHPIG